MSLASDFKVKFSVILGEEEIKQNMATFKDMSSGAQDKIPFNKLVEVIKNKLC